MTNPTIKKLRIDTLTVDHEVQRALDTRRVDRLAKDFHFEAMGVLTVSDREDDTLHLVDGQHRAAAAIQAGVGHRSVSCQVYLGLTQAEEAALFRHLNDTKQVQPLDKFRIRVIEGEPVAKQLKIVLTTHGWELSGGKRTGMFAAISALEDIYNGARIVPAGTYLTVCDALLATITAAWGHNPHGVRNEIVRGMGLFLLRNHTQVDYPKFITQLAKFDGGPLNLVGKAKQLQDIRGGNVSNAMAEILVTLYNKHRRSNLLPDWNTTESE